MRLPSGAVMVRWIIFGALGALDKPPLDREMAQMSTSTPTTTKTTTTTTIPLAPVASPVNRGATR
jgi:hypothetical protein